MFAFILLTPMYQTPLKPTLNLCNHHGKYYLYTTDEEQNSENLRGATC